ncbi:MAG: GDSL-type esterase/lipase family protein [Polyangiaceae bacterium]
MRLRYPELLRACSLGTLLVACGSAKPLATGNSEGGSMAIGGSAPDLSSAGAPTAGGSNAGASSGGTAIAGATSNSAGAAGAITPAAGGASAGSGTGGSLGVAGGATAGAAGASVNQGDLPAITLHLAGDSTVMDYGASSAQEGWGQELGQFFIGKVTIDNRALGGASIQTFQSRWTGIVSSLEPGDFAMADFGINDSGTVEGRSVSTTDFQKALSQMNQQTKARQATFIIVTPSALQYWSGGMETNARLAPYVAVENALGLSDQIPIDDLNAQSLKFLNMIGQTAAKDIYINGDKAHFTKLGATQMAKFVAAELQRINSPLAAYLK